ncbi:MAG: DNA polymerase III subunit alpha, partial [Desulfatitalea sp.]|nr:DNA polymerase III subunit alpha [Desulfatitalea sp.]
CRTLEGLPRHASTHAAGVVIGDKPLVDYLPLYRGKKGEVVTQFDMKHVEMIGLVKFDFLGLRNLTVIDHALALIRQQGKQPPDLSNLDFDDRPTYALLAAGDTTGVFQLEPSGMKDLLARLKPESFADITALVALYRPGPLDSGMVDDFVERKHGRKAVEYMFPELEPLLKETYGVVVYQEQVMKIASVLASYTMGEADGLRKAMGKKDTAMMAEHRERFVKGAVANGHDEKKAIALFDLMEKFGGYGFNKSHSAAYALIAYQTAYLKAHFPVEFIAALLTSEMHSIDGVVKYINECRTHQIEVLPPDVNSGDTTFTVSDAKIRFGLVAVKNVGEGAVEVIAEERRARGPFQSLFDFCERVDLRKVNKRVLEGLVACGAFDATGARRSQMMAVLEEALEYGQKGPAQHPRVARARAPDAGERGPGFLHLRTPPGAAPEDHGQVQLFCQRCDRRGRRRPDRAHGRHGDQPQDHPHQERGVDGLRANGRHGGRHRSGHFPIGLCRLSAPAHR